MKNHFYCLIIVMLMSGINICAFAGGKGEAKIVAQSQGTITFVVDENLSEPASLDMTDGADLAEMLLRQFGIDGDSLQLIASSFADQSLAHVGTDVFFRCLVKAYAEHRPVVLSPDMIWLLIAQGFSKYVNAHAEQLRSLLVSHEGKMEIAVRSQNDLLAETGDWPAILDGFNKQISAYTKDGIAETITANFTTTGLPERLASEITLMDAVKAFFDYTVFYFACGIPSVTLLGTPADWRLVLEKTRKLSKYGLTKWVGQLEPLLQEFINTAEGRPNRRFWQSVVKKHKVDELKGGPCSDEKPTKINGWMLRLFPDENGNTLSKVNWNADMDSEMVRVGFRYKRIAPDSSLIDETPMELYAGFVGVEQNATSLAVKPVIGWMVRKADSE
ncbi:MAG: DUF4419 domain-containing protein [Prevotella sp.]|nr:DUF4419 domain-containing protein [Prevotella sp.]